MHYLAVTDGKIKDNIKIYHQTRFTETIKLLFLFISEVIYWDLSIKVDTLNTITSC